MKRVASVGLSKVASGSILQGGELLTALVDDMLDLTRIEAGKIELKPAAFSAKDMLEKSVRLFQEKARDRSIALTLDVLDSVGAIVADERRVTQVVFNLLSNAIKFTPDGGRVGVEARYAGNNLEVAVWDTGIGIADEDLGKLFSPFQKLATSFSDNIPGTGLGLHFCKSIVELHGGHIWVESQLGRGSRFSFSLPAQGVHNAGT
jgi:signal transduction histidine kinase